MECSTQASIPIEDASSTDGSIVFRTELNPCEDDLSEEAKEQFGIHTELLRAHQLAARNVLSNNRLSPVGRHMFCVFSEENYTTCKNVLNYVAAHPELKTSTRSMRPPLILCGLPRTGSTLLYNLLACDPECRAPLATDMIVPVPPIDRSSVSEQMQRAKVVSAQDDIFKELGQIDFISEMNASHPFYAHEEDQIILTQAGLDWIYYLLAPGKDNELITWWLNDANKDFLYTYHKTFIQMLNSVDAPRSHWLLKSPTHAFFIDTLLRHYPGASIILTHRRLEDVFASFARLMLVSVKPFLDGGETDPTIDRSTVLELVRQAVDVSIRRLVEFRRTNRDTPVIDILYDDIVSQPIDTVRRIYEHFGLKWSEDFELAMNAWLRENPQGKRGRNTYTLEEFGLEREAIEKCYKEYNSLFLKSQDQAEKNSDHAQD